MKYFLDTEFLEGKQKKTLFGMIVGHTKPTIDLISIGIKAEDGRELYLLSKDFNLHEAWNRYEVVDTKTDEGIYGKKKVYWIRENVLKTIYKDFVITNRIAGVEFTYEGMKWVLSNYGLTNKEIADKVRNFCSQYTKPEFYGYYSDYDWVVFCWLFGRMIELPTNFPMYCIDLKQLHDEKQDYVSKYKPKTPFIKQGEILKKNPYYPKEVDNHSAIEDARWTKELYDFLIRIK